MSTVGLSFGSATSGDGFDVTTTVSSIMALQRAPETTWKDRITSLQSQDTALTTLGTDVSSLSIALSDLTAFDGVLSSKTGASSNTDAIALTSADTTARAGTHTITVTQLAQTSSQYSSVAASSDTLDGTITLQVGSGMATSITLDSSNNTLSTLASYINSQDFGVTASVISDSSGSRISLISNTSGTAGELTVSSSITNTTQSSDFTFTVAQQAQDAKYTVDGLSMTSSSNTVQNAITGVTMQLLATATNVQVQIVNDTSSVATALQSFVTAYNQLISDMSTQEGNDSSGTAEPLYGSSILSTLQSRLSSAMSTVSSGSGSIQWLSQLGITMGTDGTLSLNTSTLSTALNSHFSDVQNFFQTAGNFGQNLTTTLLGLGNTSTTGAISMALSENADEEDQLQDNIDNMETRLSAYEASLTTQLTSANQILQSIPQQLNEVKQIYAAITGYDSSS